MQVNELVAEAKNVFFLFPYSGQPLQAVGQPSKLSSHVRALLQRSFVRKSLKTVKRHVTVTQLIWSASAFVAP